MATDATLPVRRAILTTLKGIEAVTDLVPEASIHPRGEPAWPFVRYGGPSVIPLTATCIDGCEVSFALHAFSKGRWDGDSLLETAEDHAARIGSALAAGLDKRALILDTSHRSSVRWTGSQLMPDGAEEDAWHSVQQFRVRVIA